MTQRFTDLYVSRRHRFSLGKDQQTGGLYLSTPISGSVRAVEFEAYFRISAEEYARFSADPSLTESFLEECRQHLHSDRLIG
ncbi:MAG: hypothetical protein IR164_07790 [Devosia sp.]|jgi:hypothetical protein|uniref:hypothetical protein n=1 Tax=unclassified Devosia TaxID=196773 RepID=UPI0019E09CA7|nr:MULTISPECIES: hypothetical protein [unclassified Devosia]MBF0678824.1 hypothetical protein [Devosia sp.]WEJ32714.1 hypothetical protein NYQ88_17805 [Devosia sp. SD17-2]